MKKTRPDRRDVHRYVRDLEAALAEITSSPRPAEEPTLTRPVKAGELKQYMQNASTPSWTTGNPSKVEENIVAMMTQVLENRHRPWEVCSAIADENGLFNASHTDGRSNAKAAPVGKAGIIPQRNISRNGNLRVPRGSGVPAFAGSGMSLAVCGTARFQTRET